MNSQSISYHFLAMLLRAALVIALVGAGWLVYKKLPNDGATNAAPSSGQTTVLIILRVSAEFGAGALDIPVELSPVDPVAIRQEYRSDPQSGKRFDEFRNERMNGRALVSTNLNQQGQVAITIPAGNWWILAVLPGEVDLEWRLPVTITGNKQIIELTPQNAYFRSKSF
jgi:hypothetical protein